MQTTQIKEMFSAAVRTKQFLTVNNDCDGEILGDYRHHVFSYQALPSLIEKLKQSISTSFSASAWYEEDYTVRYVVTNTGMMWFAISGKPNHKTPSHADMASNCIAAGDILWSTDFSEIIKINNQSGHFQAHCNTMVWVISSLLAYNAAFAPSVTVDFCLNTTDIESHDFTVDELKSLIPVELRSITLRDEFIVNVFAKNTVTHDIDEYTFYDKDSYQDFLDKPRCAKIPEATALTTCSKRKFGLFAELDTEFDQLNPATLQFPSTPPHRCSR